MPHHAPTATRSSVSERPSADAAVPAGGLSITVGTSHGVLVLTVRGEIDLASAPLLEEELRRAEAADVKLVVINLAGVEFMDSTGLHTLLRARERIEQSGPGFSLSRISPQVRRLLELTGTLGRFTVDGLQQVARAPGGPGLHA